MLSTRNCCASACHWFSVAGSVCAVVLMVCDALLHMRNDQPNATYSAIHDNERRLAVHAVFQIRGDTLYDGWRLKPRLRATPQSLPPQTAERTPTGRPVGSVLQPATAGFVAERNEAVQARFQPPALHQNRVPL